MSTINNGIPHSILLLLFSVHFSNCIQYFLPLLSPPLCRSIHYTFLIFALLRPCSLFVIFLHFLGNLRSIDIFLQLVQPVAHLETFPRKYTFIIYQLIQFYRCIFNLTSHFSRLCKPSRNRPSSTYTSKSYLAAQMWTKRLHLLLQLHHPFPL